MTKPKGDCRSAFPRASISNNKLYINDPGMTIREWYAGQALTGLLAGNIFGYSQLPEAAQDAVKLADAVISELQRTTDG